MILDKDIHAPQVNKRISLDERLWLKIFPYIQLYSMNNYYHYYYYYGNKEKEDVEDLEEHFIINKFYRYGLKSWDFEKILLWFKQNTQISERDVLVYFWTAQEYARECDIHKSKYIKEYYKYITKETPEDIVMTIYKRSKMWTRGQTLYYILENWNVTESFLRNTKKYVMRMYLDNNIKPKGWMKPATKDDLYNKYKEVYKEVLGED